VLVVGAAVDSEDEASKKEVEAARATLRLRAVSAATVGTQAVVAAGLLQLLPLKPRTIGALGAPPTGGGRAEPTLGCDLAAIPSRIPSHLISTVSSSSLQA